MLSGAETRSGHLRDQEKEMIEELIVQKTEAVCIY